MHRLLRATAVLSLCAATLAGCATHQHNTQVQDGPGLEFKAADVTAFHENQAAVLTELQKMANLPDAPTGTQWDLVIDAGMDFADSRCEAYLHALFRLNRDKRTVTSQIGLLGTASAGLMAAAESAAKEVAAVAVLFGLANSTVDNLANNVLYDLDPSSVRTLVKSLQSAYRSNLQSGYTTRPAAFRVIRAYAMLCVPSNIESEVNLAIKKAAPAANQGSPETGQPPSVSHAETAVGTFKSRPDDNTTLLRRFVFPDGSLNPTNRMRLEQFLRDKKLQVDVTSFMQLERFANERAEAVTLLNLK